MKDRLFAGTSLILLVALACFLELRVVAVLPTFLVVVALAAVGTLEMLRMLRSQGIEVLGPALWAACALVLAGVGVRALEPGTFPGADVLAAVTLEGAAIGLLLVTLTHAILRQDVERGLERATWSVVPLLWITGGMATLVVLRSAAPGAAGLERLVFFVAIAKVGDICGYFFGRAFGRHRAIPRISPGKTWEGCAASFVGATALAGVLGVTAGWLPSGAGWLLALGAGACINLAAQFGDLAMSLAKRRLRVKDTGRLFPGIGGVLDLVDSFLFAGPAFVLYQRAAGLL